MEERGRAGALLKCMGGRFLIKPRNAPGDGCQGRGPPRKALSRRTRGRAEGPPLFFKIPEARPRRRGRRPNGLPIDFNSARVCAVRPCSHLGARVRVPSHGNSELLRDALIGPRLYDSLIGRIFLNRHCAPATRDCGIYNFARRAARARFCE